MWWDRSIETVQKLVEDVFLFRGEGGNSILCGRVEVEEVLKGHAEGEADILEGGDGGVLLAVFELLDI